MTGIHDVVVNTEQQTVSVGAGALWVDVYSKLDPLEIGIGGGRIARVGVGGLTLGGINSLEASYAASC